MFVSGTVSRTRKGPNSGLFECDRSKFEAVGEVFVLLAGGLDVTAQKESCSMPPPFQKADFFNTPYPFGNG